MNVIEVTQGSQEWLTLRATCDTASEAPAALGDSKYTSRTALMKQKSTGLSEEVSPSKQVLFDRGHSTEAAARPLAEAIIGAELYPVTATLKVGNLNLLASLDGATMDEAIIWEHKLYSDALASAVKAGTLAPHYTVQMDQQLLVSGAEKCLFMTSDGTADNMAYCWYLADAKKFTALINGWTQFNADLAAYVPTEVVVAPVAKPQMSLPAVSIQVNGSIALIDNLGVFGAALTAYVERINKTPETDQDFADLEATVKTLKSAEEALEAAERGALAQTDSIDTMRRTVGLYRETARTNRLLVEKLVKVEKENRRAKILSDASAEYAAHLNSLNTRIGKAYMPMIPADFAAVVKGLKSLDSMKDKVAGEMARCKIEANATADKIQTNLATLRELAANHAFLFADIPQIIFKANDDLTALIKSRIADHTAAEAVKAESLRERIRAEEVAKLAREQAERERNESNARANAVAEAEKNALDAMTLATAPPCHQTVVPTRAPVLSEKVDADRNAAAFIDRIEAKHSEPPSLKLGQIAERLGFALTADFLKSLGFEPAATEKGAKLFHESDFPLICAALVAHIESVCELA